MERPQNADERFWKTIARVSDTMNRRRNATERRAAGRDGGGFEREGERDALKGGRIERARKNIERTQKISSALEKKSSEH